MSVYGDFTKLDENVNYRSLMIVKICYILPDLYFHEIENLCVLVKFKILSKRNSGLCDKDGGEIFQSHVTCATSAIRPRERNFTAH